MESSSSGRGRAGEARAAALLEAEGWSVLARNYRAGRGEIDVVALREGILAFIEVKTWRGFGSEELERAIGPTKRRRIVETAKIFLAQYREYSNARIRFDVLLLSGEGVVHRIESAFTGEL